MLTLKPTLDRVLIKNVPVTSAGGILLADGHVSQKLMLHGEVLAIGTGRIMGDGTIMPINSVKVGDRVIYGSLMSNIEDYSTGEKLVLVQEIGIVAVIEGEAEVPKSLIVEA